MFVVSLSLKQDIEKYYVKKKQKVFESLSLSNLEI